MLIFREAKPADALKIAELHATSWQRTYRGNFSNSFLDGDVYSDRNNVWTSRLNQPQDNQYVCVAEANEEICGFICCYGDNSSEWGSLIDNLHIDRDFQKQGLGRQLLSHTGDWLSRNYPEQGVYLIVWELNPALNFYLRHGGRNTGLKAEINPDGGIGKYFRIVWEKPALLKNKTISPG